MTEKKRKVRGGKMKWVLIGFLAVIVLYLLIQGIRCISGLRNAQEKLRSYEVSTAILSYGSMTYVDAGEGDVILSVRYFRRIRSGVRQRPKQRRKPVCSHRRALAISVPTRGKYLRNRRSFRGTTRPFRHRSLLSATSAGGTPPFVSR